MVGWNAFWWHANSPYPSNNNLTLANLLSLSKEGWKVLFFSSIFLMCTLSLDPMTRPHWPLSCNLMWTATEHLHSVTKTTAQQKLHEECKRPLISNAALFLQAEVLIQDSSSDLDCPASRWCCQLPPKNSNQIKSKTRTEKQVIGSVSISWWVRSSGFWKCQHADKGCVSERATYETVIQSHT